LGWSVFFLADWHTWINNKLGGNREVIKRVAVGYFKEGFKASLKCVGGDLERVKFVLGLDLYHNNDKYWATFVRVCKELTLSRVKNRFLLPVVKQEREQNLPSIIILF